MINFKSKLVRGSLALLILVGIFNALNFLYHILMARTLPLEDFGLLKRIFAFLYIGAIFMESIQTVIVRYVSKNVHEDGKLKTIFIKSNKKMAKVSIAVGGLFLAASLLISPLFDIPYMLLIATSFFIAGSMFAPIARGILQGQQRFLALGSSMLVEAALKIGISFLLVYWGLGVFGAVGGVVISLVLSMGLSLIYLRKVLSSNSEDVELTGIRSYSRPVFLVTLVLILFINVDILLAGNLLGKLDAGVYAIASTIALIIFIGIQPVNKVLFPITAIESYKNIPSMPNFIRAMTIVLSICAVALTVILFFTEEIVYIISGELILEAVVPARLLSLGTAFLSLSSTILYYKLSIGRTKGYGWVLAFLLMEIILLAIFSSNIVDYSYAFLVANILFFIGSVVLLKK